MALRANRNLQLQVVLQRVELTAAWRAITFEATAVNGTLSIMSETSLTYWLDDVAVIAGNSV